MRSTLVRSLIVATSCLSLVGVASTASAATSTPTARKVIVRGKVTDSVTGKPVVGACVKIHWIVYQGPLTCVTTDKRGKYQTSRAAEPGDGPDMIEVAPAATDLGHAGGAWKPDGQTTGTKIVINAKLPPAGVLSGVVVADRTHGPVAGICPEVRGVSLPDGVSKATATCSDEQGRWQLTGVVAGSVAVALVGSGDLQGSYVGGGTKVADAIHYDVVPGEVTPLPSTYLTAAATLVIRTDLDASRDNQVVITPRQAMQDIVSGTTVASPVYDDDGTSVFTITGLQVDNYTVSARSAAPRGECVGEDFADVPLTARTVAPADQDYCDTWEWWAPFDGSGVRRPVHLRSGQATTLTLTTKS